MILVKPNPCCLPSDLDNKSLESNEASVLVFINKIICRKHLERNRKDRDAKFRLILVESRIHRLAR